MLRKLTLISIVALCLVLVVPTFAQDTPSVTVNDQIVMGDHVTIAEVVSSGAGFIVIHADNGEGAPGPVIGNEPVMDGTNTDVEVEIETELATPTLFAMLHTDDNEMGVYEFGTVEGADGPVSVDGAVVTPPFAVDIVDMPYQFLEENVVTADAVVAQVDGWLVVHADADGSPGPVLGQSCVTAGINAPVPVELEGDITPTLWPMLHVDTGEAEVYEFGQVEGADGPVAMDGTVLTYPINTFPSIQAEAQDIAGMETPVFEAEAVLSEAAGWLVVHADGDGAPGPVIGFSPVSAGTNRHVEVELDAEGMTDTVWPMLHVDTGAEGEYEFGTVEGADGPVSVDGEVVTFPVSATGEEMMME